MKLNRLVAAFSVAIAAACAPAGSGAAGVPAATVAVQPNQQMQFRVSLPLRNKPALARLLEDLHDETSPSYRQWLTPDQFNARFGADPASVARVTAALKTRGLNVVATQTSGMIVQGNVAAIQAMLGTTLRNTRAASGNMRTIATTAPVMPAELTNEGAHVAAFRALSEHRVYSRKTVVPNNRYSAVGPYWFSDLKQAYDFPSVQVYSGHGRTIAIVITNDFLDSDMAAYFGHEKLKVPKFVRVPVLGGAPFDPNISVETTLDLQQSGGLAPGATIKHYNIPDLSDDSILTAYAQIVDDNAADIVSSSFGEFEAGYFASYNFGVDYTGLFDDYEAIFAQGNAQGITFVAASGDDGGLPTPPAGYFFTGPGKTFAWQPGVSFPASSPHVTAVGGTNLLTSSKTSSLESKYVGENAFGDALLPEDPYGTGNLLTGGYFGSGGGVSAVFSKPAYQNLVPTRSTMRTVPDIALQMGGCPYGTISTCPTDRSAVLSVLDGQLIGLIGTSVSAPGFAGLLAVEEERLGGVRLGNVNKLIYAQAALQAVLPGVQYFHKGIQGFNGYDYSGGIYDRVLGVGTVDARNFILAPFVPAAGNPQTPTNP